MAGRKKRDDNQNTKLWCQTGLIVSWFVGMGSALAGGICLYLELRDGNAVFFLLDHTWREILPLGLNIVGKYSHATLLAVVSSRPNCHRNSHTPQ